MKLETLHVRYEALRTAIYNHGGHQIGERRKKSQEGEAL